MKHSKNSKSDLVYSFFQFILVISLMLITFQKFTISGEKTDITTPTTIVPLIINDDPNFDMGGIEIIKYHNNVVQNAGSGSIEINGKSLAAGSIDSIIITNEEIVSINTSNGSYMVQTKENIQQTISIQKIVSMSGDDVKLSDLQKYTGFRATISDDYADQLDFQITGPVTYKIAKRTNDIIVIDITLNVYNNEEDFDRYAKKDASEKYNTAFSITVKDKIAPYTSTDKGLFTYTEW